MSDNIQYGFFHPDKAAEPGFSKELISMDFQKFKTETNTEEHLNVWPHANEETKIDTLIKGLERIEKRTPNHPLFGTKKEVTDGK